jgi:predicted amidohydrolase YtcJ
MFAAALAVVLANAHVVTMNPAQPEATALAVVDGRIAYVGNDVSAARKAAGPGAEVIDVAGRTVTPGFDDAHVHFGLSLTLGSSRGLDLGELGKRAFVNAVKKAAAARPGDDWLFVKMREMPAGIGAARDLDFLPRPIFLISSRGGLLNTRAKALGGFSDEEAPHGFIHGRVLAAALDRLVKALPYKTLHDGARAFLASLARQGITSVQLISDELPDVFESLRLKGQLTARIRMVPLGYRFETHLYEPSWKAPAPEWLRIEGVKYFTDDSARITRFELKEIAARAAKTSRPVVVHVLSKRALDGLLDGIEVAAKTLGQPKLTSLFRVEHADEVTREQAARLQRDGIIVCSNPSMLPEWHKDDAFPMHTLIEAGVRTCIGTDWVGEHLPARPISPLETLSLAVTHGGFGTKERITAAQALEAYTLGSATAEGQAAHKGSLEPGKLADLIVLAGDPLKTPPDQLPGLKVLMTMVGGNIVYRSGEFAEPVVHRPPPPSIGPQTPQPTTIGPPRPAPPSKN